MAQTVTGPVYVVGDNVDTDQIIPAEYLSLVPTIPEEYRKLGSYAFAGLAGGHPPFVTDGDRTRYRLVIGGRNFGCGSSREHAPIALGAAGAEAVVAESYARIFFRNCVATGELYPVESPARLVGEFVTGDEAVLDLDASTLENRRTGKTFSLRPLGEARPVIDAGGLFNYARQTGMIAAPREDGATRVSGGAEPIVVVVGATGLVGEEIVAVLAERQFPAAEVRALASAASAGLRVSFGAEELTVRAANDDAFDGAGVVFLCAGATVSERWAARLAATGAVVVDLSDRFTTVPEVPMLVPGVNLGAVVAAGGARLVSVGGAAAGALAAVLGPLDAAAGVRAVTVATYEPASVLGRAGAAELGEQATALLGGREVNAEVFPRQIAFSCIPAIGALDAAGHAHAECVLRDGLRRILDRPTLAVAATTVHVPTFFGLGAAVTIELERALDVAAAHAVLREAPSVVVSEGEGYATTFDAVGSDGVHVARLRAHEGRPGCLGLWIAIDNTRKAAATNAVVIAEALLQGA